MGRNICPTLCLLCATPSAQLQPTRAREAKGLSHPVKETCPYQCPFSLLTPIRELKKLAGVSVFLSLYTPVILIIPNMQASNLKGKATQTQCKTNLCSYIPQLQSPHCKSVGGLLTSTLCPPLKMQPHSLKGIWRIQFPFNSKPFLVFLPTSL